MFDVSGFATSTINDNYEIDSVKELKRELSELQEKENITDNEREKFIETITPVVMSKFMEMKIDEAVKEVNDINPDNVMKNVSGEKLYGKTTIDIGDTCIVTVEFEDNEEPTVLSKIKNSLIIPVYAATNGETMWKDYGNRYFTASATILSGIGGAVIKLENHYTLSSSGIDERYGDAYVQIGFSVGITGSVSPGTVVITDSYARTPGESDVNMYARYNYQYSSSGTSIVQGSRKLSTTVGYVAINKTTKQIKVKHSWSLS